MCLFRHGQRGVGRRTRRRASFEEDIEVESRGEIQTEGVTLDEEVRYRRNIGALKEQMTQMEQGNAQGCPAMLRVPFWPELFREGLACQRTAAADWYGALLADPAMSSRGRPFNVPHNALLLSCEKR